MVDPTSCPASSPSISSRSAAYPGVARSNFPRNARESPSASASAAERKNFNTSAGGSASATEAAIRNRARRISGPVAGVDADVILGEVAGPEARMTSAASPELEQDRAFRLVQLPGELLFGKVGGQPAAAHRQTLHVNVDTLRIEGDAR